MLDFVIVIFSWKNLPQDFLNQSFVEHSVTGYGEPLIIMELKDIDLIKEYCDKKMLFLKVDDV